MEKSPVADETVLLAVKPRFAEAILDGTKTVEFRRRRAHAQSGSIGLLYASSPRRSLVGAIRLGAVESWAPSTIWRKWGGRSGLSKPEFTRHFADAPIVTAIEICAAVAFTQAVDLSELRARSSGFLVPQSYRFITDAESKAVLNGQSSHIARIAKPRPG